jgi:hypothetical protein
MNMHAEDWPGYKQKLLDSFKDTGADYRGYEADINALAELRLERQLDAADRLYNELHPAGKTTDQVLAEAQQQLLDALASGASPREIRMLQAKIKLLEPDAYGTREAKVGVVDRMQGASRAKTRAEAWEALGKGRDPQAGTRERAALAAQEGSASAAKLRHAAPAQGATTAQAISVAKYLGRVYEAFGNAGLSLQSSLIDRTGEVSKSATRVVGAKQEVKATDAAMGELRRWAQDSGRHGLTDQEVRDAFVKEANNLADELELRLRRNEAVQAGVDPTGAELEWLAARRRRSGGGGSPTGGPATPPSAPPPPGPSGPDQSGKGPDTPSGSPPQRTPPGGPPGRPPGPPSGGGPASGARRFNSAADVHAAVVDAVSKLKTSMADADLPPNYDVVTEALAQGKTGAHRQLRKLVPIVEKGLRTPELYGAVLAEAWQRAIVSGTDINGGLLEMAREGGLAARIVPEAKNGQEFFRENVIKNKVMVDKGIGEAHGINSHLVHDLVVDRALRAAGRSESAADFRMLLGRVHGRAGRTAIPLGDLIWRVTYDVESEGHINEPESLKAALDTLDLGFK